MQKPKLRPVLFAIKWGNPYTNPPEGMPRELIATTRMQESTRDIPPEILQVLETVARPGSGWHSLLALTKTPGLSADSH